MWRNLKGSPASSRFQYSEYQVWRIVTQIPLQGLWNLRNPKTLQGKRQCFVLVSFFFISLHPHLLRYAHTTCSLALISHATDFNSIKVNLPSHSRCRHRITYKTRRIFIWSQEVVASGFGSATARRVRAKESSPRRCLDRHHHPMSPDTPFSRDSVGNGQYHRWKWAEAFRIEWFALCVFQHFSMFFWMNGQRIAQICEDDLGSTAISEEHIDDFGNINVHHDRHCGSESRCNFQSIWPCLFFI